MYVCVCVRARVYVYVYTNELSFFIYSPQIVSQIKSPIIWRTPDHNGPNFRKNYVGPVFAKGP